MPSVQRATSRLLGGPYLTTKIHLVICFHELPFIYTGNKLNVMTMPNTITFGMSKSVVAHLIKTAVQAYRAKGYKSIIHCFRHERRDCADKARFYYTVERLIDGTHAGVKYDGPARGKEYVDLAGDKEQREWHYTFVKEVGYVDFSDLDSKFV
ncbi:uncharacterized protein LY89DRAFT_718675 [Mollisia scopiformis]|uniref:Uncharacterized protein n=1 Tax=Mollisia scopiformis TaxID=149040 RepID=A0A194X9X0_MOLSC|nr:uncharacterized protein LY89DRAFT_718675 [Mollisia scopiformis]KUJ16965.1 hypothetical protein LY89DRAFT_718675 [Mollisia scopiformis]